MVKEPHTALELVKDFLKNQGHLKTLNCLLKKNKDDN